MVWRPWGGWLSTAVQWRPVSEKGIHAPGALEEGLESQALPQPPIRHLKKRLESQKFQGLASWVS